MEVDRNTARQRGLEVLKLEAAAIGTLAERLDDSFDKAVAAVLNCTGRVVVSGMGKAGLIGQKISATLASIGTPSLCLHPAEAMHGDLGRVRAEDLVLLLSKSGATREVVAMVPPLKAIGATTLAITESGDSALGQACDLVLEMGPLSEACPLGLAPTVTTTAMLALGDALAMSALEGKEFTREEFAAFHPAGSLGRSLMRIGDIMRTGKEVPLIKSGSELRQVIEIMTETPGRPGAAIVVNAAGELAGIFTDGDLRRMACENNLPLNDSVDNHMANDPSLVRENQLVGDALRIIKDTHLDQLPVLASDNNKVVGLVDVQDLIEVRL